MYLYTIYRSYLTAEGAEKYCQLEAFPQTISSEKASCPKCPWILLTTRTTQKCNEIEGGSTER